jgi:imidazoleglycerol-phosphate dehydratase
MLEIFSHHSLIDLKLKAEGDIHVDFHHTVEDAAYVLAEAINKLLEKKKELIDMVFFIYLWMKVYLEQ